MKKFALALVAVALLAVTVQACPPAVFANVQYQSQVVQSAFVLYPSIAVTPVFVQPQVTVVPQVQVQQAVCPQVAVPQVQAQQAVCQQVQVQQVQAAAVSYGQSVVVANVQPAFAYPMFANVVQQRVVVKQRVNAVRVNAVNAASASAVSVRSNSFGGSINVNAASANAFGGRGQSVTVRQRDSGGLFARLFGTNVVKVRQ